MRNGFLVLSGLGLGALGSYACSDSNDDGPQDSSTEDGSLAADGFTEDGGELLDAGKIGDATDVSDSSEIEDAGDAGDAGDAAPWHTVLGQNFSVNDVLTTPSGLTYLVGARSVAGVLRGVVVRLLANGQLDVSFGVAGYADVVLSQTTANQPMRGILQANGQLVMIGVVYSSPWDLVMTRLDGAGSIDATFGTSGVTRMHAGVGNDLPFGIAPGPLGGSIFTGLAFGATNFQSEIVVGRVDANGGLDATFDGDGMALTSIGGTNGGRGIGLLSQDRVLVAAQSENVDEMLLLRFTTAGALDPTFSAGQDAGGKVIPAGARILRFASASSCSPDGLHKDGSGKWVIYGNGSVPGADAGTTRSAMVAARVDEDGVLDPTFHNGGGPFYLTPTGSSKAYSFASQAGGRAILAGGVYEGPLAPFDSTKYWPGFVALDTSGNRDVAALLQGFYVPHAYPGSDGLVAALPNGHFVAVVSKASAVEAFEMVP